MRNRSTSLAALLLTSVFAASSPAAAQDYPKKQIELVVPFVAGGTTDNVARLIAQRFSESWGQTVIVNNRPGGGSTIGHAVVAKAPPDGHTLLVTTISFAITAVMQKLVRSDQGFRPDQRVRLAAADIGGASVAAGDQSQGIHRDGEVEGGRMGLRLLRRRHLAAPRGRDVQVDGRRRPGARALQGQRRGDERVSGRPHQDLFALVPAVLQHIKAGSLRPIAVTTEQRLPYLPDVPTIAESGFPGYEISSWQGVFAPGGTPRDVVGKINGEVVRLLSVPEVRARISLEGADPVGSSPMRSPSG